MSLGVSGVAKASSGVGLSFELPPSPQQEAEAAAAAAEAAAPPQPEPPPQALVSADAPLPIPPGAEEPPMAGDNSRPAGVYGGLNALAIGAAPSVSALLPPPPPVPDYLSQPAIAVVPEAVPEEVAASPEPPPEEKVLEPIGFTIGFLDKTFESPEPPKAEAPQPVAAKTFQYSFENFQVLFEGGTDSLVARAVGSAEGTRTPEGHKNPAYYGHVDPGNGVWNLGTFSYQHGAQSPEDADDRQLRRLQTQTEKLRQKALNHGLQLSQEELLNGIDLANQAPLAALDRGGYIDWLKEAHKLGMTGSEAIVWARTRSFIDPDTQRWNAPGLGNNVYSISHDQERRANAIARAITAFNTQTQIAIAPAPSPNPEPEAAPAAAETDQNELIREKVSLAFGESLSQDAATSQTIAAAEQIAPDSQPLSDESNDQLEPVALTAPKAWLPFNLGATAIFSQPAEKTPNPDPATESSLLNRFNNTLARVLNRPDPSSDELSDASAIAVPDQADVSLDTVAPTAESSSENRTPVIPASTESAPPAEAAAAKDLQLREDASSTTGATDTAEASTARSHAAAFAEPRVLQPDDVEDADAIVDEMLRDLAADSPPLDVAPASDVAEASPADDDGTGVEARSAATTTAVEAAQAPEAAVVLPTDSVASDEPSPTAFDDESSEMPPAQDADQHESKISRLELPSSLPEPVQTKAPAQRTDAKTLQQQTLDSLDRFQLRLRQASEE